jgi:hypothetical protein
LLLAYLLSLRFTTNLAGLVNAGAAGLICLQLVSLKLYPIFGLAALMVQRSLGRPLGLATSRIFSLDKFAVLFGSVLGLMATFPFLRGMKTVAKEGGLRSHGLLAFGYMNNTLIDAFGLDSARVLIKALLLIKLASLLLGLHLAWKARLHEALMRCWQSWTPQANVFSQILFVMMSAVWLGCYGTVINIDSCSLFSGWVCRLAWLPIRLRLFLRSGWLPGCLFRCSLSSGFHCWNGIIPISL